MTIAFGKVYHVLGRMAMLYIFPQIDNLFFYVFIWIRVCTTKCVLALHLFELGKCCVGGIIKRDGKYYTLVIFLSEASSEIVTKSFDVISRI